MAAKPEVIQESDDLATRVQERLFEDQENHRKKQLHFYQVVPTSPKCNPQIDPPPDPDQIFCHTSLFSSLT